MSAREVPIGVDDPQDGSPSMDELEQREEHSELPIPAVPVHIDGPVQTQEVPARHGQMLGVTISTTAEMISGRDLRRKRLTLLTRDADFFVGSDRTNITAWWPAGVPLVLVHCEPVWVKADATPTLLTVVNEGWAE